MLKINSSVYILILFNYGIMLCPVTTNTTKVSFGTTINLLAINPCHMFRRQTVILRHVQTALNIRKVPNYIITLDHKFYTKCVKMK